MRTAALVAVSLLALASQPAAAACPDTSFEGAREFYGGRQPTKLAFANIDRDRWPDLVVGSRDNNGFPAGGITVLRGDGGRSWPVHQELLPSHNVIDLVAADFDADGDDDVAYLQDRTDGDPDSGRRLRVLLNADGTLVPAGVIVLDEFPQGLISGDVNGDGRHDLVVHGGLVHGAAALLFTSNGDGTFVRTPLAAGSGSAVSGDLDGDGRDDVAVTTSVENRFELLIFDGRAEGVAAPRRWTLPYVPRSLWVADVDGDGAKDVVVNSGELEIVFRAGSAEAELRSHLPQEISSIMERVVVADLNGDGMDDAVFDDGGVKMLMGAADGHPVTTLATWAPQRYVGGAADIDAADVDSDGDPDVAVITDHGFAVLENDGRGTFGGPLSSALALATADLNGDGRDDVVWHGADPGRRAGRVDPLRVA